MPQNPTHRNWYNVQLPDGHQRTVWGWADPVGNVRWIEAEQAIPKARLVAPAATPSVRRTETPAVVAEPAVSPSGALVKPESDQKLIAQDATPGAGDFPTGGVDREALAKTNIVGMYTNDPTFKRPQAVGDNFVVETTSPGQQVPLPQPEAENLSATGGSISWLLIAAVAAGIFYRSRTPK